MYRRQLSLAWAQVVWPRRVAQVNIFAQAFLQLVACALPGSGKSRAVHQLPSPRQPCGVALAPGGSQQFSAAGWVPARFGSTQVAA